MKTLVAAAALSLAATAAIANTAPLPLDHGLFANGLKLQGFRYNGIKLQGLPGDSGVVLTGANPFVGLDTAPLGQ